jgi:hypothetical protein
MKKLALVLTTAALTFLAGCGKPQTSTFHGKVSCGGKPLASGVIYFLGPAPELRMGMGTIQDNGTYTATDVPVGEVRVAFQAPGAAAKYTDPNKSPLIYTITQEMTSLDIDAP